MNKLHNTVFLLATLTILLLISPVLTHGQDLTEAQRRQRCASNERFIVEYDRQLSEIEDNLVLTNDEEIARARTQLKFLRTRENRRVPDEVIDNEIETVKKNCR